MRRAGLVPRSSGRASGSPAPSPPCQRSRQALPAPFSTWEAQRLGLPQPIRGRHIPAPPRYIHGLFRSRESRLGLHLLSEASPGFPPQIPRCRARPGGHTSPPSPGWPAPCGCSWHIPGFEANLFSFANDQNRIQILKDLITDHADQMKFTEKLIENL